MLFLALGGLFLFLKCLDNRGCRKLPMFLNKTSPKKKDRDGETMDWIKGMPAPLKKDESGRVCFV